MSSARYLLPLLLLSAVAFSTAPSWVVKDTVIEYASGSDKITFTVLSNNGSDIKTQIKPSAAPNSYTATENASGLYGQFWFDSAELADAFSGQYIGDFSVTGDGTQTFAGKEYDTITLVGTVSGSETTRVYERQTGLMLKQTVDAPGAPQVVLTKFTPPAAPAPPPPPVQQPPANQTPPSNTTQPPPTNTSQPSQPPVQNPPTEQPSQPPPQETPEAPEQPGKRPITSVCCGSAMILLALFAALRKR
jgi:hypothetical protein